MKHYFDHDQEALFLQFLEQQNCSLSEEQLQNLYSYCELIIQHNQVTNLVSANDSKKLLTRHIADSLFPFIYLQNHSLIPTKGEWADMGSGAGLPVIPLCIAMPHLYFYAVEPRKKRCQFLHSVKESLNLQNFSVIESNFEKSDLHDLEFVSCRALGSLEEDYARARLSLQADGSFLTLKSWNSLEPLRVNHSPLLKKAKLVEYNLIQEPQQYVLVHLRNHG